MAAFTVPSPPSRRHPETNTANPQQPSASSTNSVRKAILIGPSMPLSPTTSPSSSSFPRQPHPPASPRQAGQHHHGNTTAVPQQQPLRHRHLHFHRGLHQLHLPSSRPRQQWQLAATNATTTTSHASQHHNPRNSSSPSSSRLPSRQQHPKLAKPQQYGYPIPTISIKHRQSHHDSHHVNLQPTPSSTAATKSNATTFITLAPPFPP